MNKYLDYLEKTNKIIFFCDFDCKELLNLIALAEKNETPMTVTQAMNAGFASPATLHRKLDMLRDFGYVKITFKGKNKRTKYLALAPRAIKYFSSLEQAMEAV